MIIYRSTVVRPYVYMGTHKTTGHIYIGYREANTVPSDIDLFIYRTSSKIVRPNFDDYDWHVVAEFFAGDDAYDFEQQLIYEHWNNPLLLNERCYHGSKARFKGSFAHINNNKEFYTAKISDWWDSLPQKDKQVINAKKSRPGQLNGMYGKDRSGSLSTTFGKNVWGDADKKRIGDMNRQMVGVKDAVTSEILGQVSVDDPRYISGEIVHCSTGFKHTEEFKKARSDEWKRRGITPPSAKGKLWWNDGISQVRNCESPGDGWVRGRIKS